MRYLSVLFCALVFAASAADIERVEPPNWWADMAHNELQLLVKGEGVGTLRASINYPGVRLAAQSSPENPNYLFLDLVLAQNLKPGAMTIEFADDEQVVATHNYRFDVREKGSAKRQGFSPKDVIYLITPDRFANGDPSNDTVEGLQEGKNREHVGGRHGGDIQGIIDNLDYLEDLGVTQLWMMPVLENDMPSYSYHGYAITDFYQIDPRYGSNALYQQLVKEADKRGMGVIMDQVLNHSGSEHWWMQDIPSSDWSNFNNQFVQTSHKRLALHDPHGTDYDLKQFADGWFVKSMPDLNQRNPYMANYLIQNSIWWVEHAGLSGIRVDTFPYPDRDFTARWSQRVMQEYPNLNIVGEEWTANPTVVAYWQRGARNYDGYQTAMPSMFDFPLQIALVKALNEPETWGTGLVQLYRALANDFQYADPYNLVIFPDNHDMSRIYTQLNEDYALWQMAMVFYATTRGIPQLYYGNEILKTNPGTEDHGVIRSDMPGGWQGDVANAFADRGLPEQQSKALNWLKKLLNWRKSAEIVHNGKLRHFAPDNGLYVYFRTLGDERLLVAMNKNDRPVALDWPRYAELMTGQTRARDVISGKFMALDKVQVGAKSALILELD